MASPSLPHLLDNSGKVRSDLFRDKAHLNKPGYAIWAGKSGYAENRPYCSSLIRSMGRPFNAADCE